MPDLLPTDVVLAPGDVALLAGDVIDAPDLLATDEAEEPVEGCECCGGIPCVFPAGFLALCTAPPTHVFLTLPALVSEAAAFNDVVDIINANLAIAPIDFTRIVFNANGVRWSVGYSAGTPPFTLGNGILWALDIICQGGFWVVQATFFTTGNGTTVQTTYGPILFDGDCDGPFVLPLNTDLTDPGIAWPEELTWAP